MEFLKEFVKDLTELIEDMEEFIEEDKKLSDKELDTKYLPQSTTKH